MPTLEQNNKDMLDELVPSFADKVRLMIQITEADDEKFSVWIVNASRSQAEQYALWLQGRDPATGAVIDPKKKVTNAKTGEKAPHCHRGAVDVVPVIAGKKLYKRLDLFDKIDVCARAAGLECGTDFGDQGHYQDPQWRTFPVNS